jgi:hypothetical protein
MRTSTNIIDTALDEINFTLQLPKRGANGDFIKIKPFRSIGLQRLRGMALTTAIVPTGIATAAEMLYDGIKYKINQFQKDVRNSRSLFTGKLLKGGPVSAEELVDAYINANRALYETNRSLYKDVEAAKVLGLSGDSIEAIMDERGVGKTYEAFENGEFRPYNVSNAVKELFEINAAQINAPDPMQQAEDVIDRIQEVLESTSITSSSFPDIENPFNKSLLPEINLGSTPVGQLPPVITGATATPNIIGAQNISLPSQQYTSLYPNDDLAKLI